MSNNKNIIFLFFLVVFCGAASGSGKENTKLGSVVKKQEVSNMKNSMLVSDSKEFVPFGDEQKRYLSDILLLAKKIISGQEKIEVSEKLFGEPRDHWPKTGLPTSRYYENRPDRHISVTFGKQNPDGPWIRATIIVEPSGFPKSVYNMALPESFFKGLILKDKYIEQRPDEPIEKIAVYIFVEKNQHGSLILQFESRENMVDLKNDKYPKSFQFLTINRI